tara:strand:- start:10024 stop:10362 length:339 start_codon:yes stop_codon:yes gene_type:complete
LEGPVDIPDETVAGLVAEATILNGDNWFDCCQAAFGNVSGKSRLLSVRGHAATLRPTIGHSTRRQRALIAVAAVGGATDSNSTANPRYSPLRSPPFSAIPNSEFIGSKSYGP